MYRYNNIWLMYNWIGANTKGLYWKKCLCEGAQMCGREHWIKRIEEVLEHMRKSKSNYLSTIFQTKLKYSWGSKNPVITCKTTEGLRKYSRVYKEDSITPTDKLPYWGDINTLRKELFNN